MIDMHSHILPAIDDGAKDIQQSLQMLGEAKRQGVDVCVATSHCKLHKQNAVDDFLNCRSSAYNTLMQGAQGADIPKIILGAEVYLDNDISRVNDVHKLCIDGTNCMLVEFGRGVPTDNYSEWLYNLTIKGITPIIAHIDRYAQRSEFIKSFDGIKIMYQVNNECVLSVFGRKFFKKLAPYTVVMGSDMHNTSSRPCDMKKAYDILAKKIPQSVDALYNANAKMILNL